MQLPETRRDQIKLLIVILLATVLAVLAIAQGIILPLRRSKHDRLDRLLECEDELAAAHRVVKFAPRDKDGNAKALTELKSISSRYILHPVLGNYALRASGIIEDHLKRNSLEAESISEIGVTEAPRADDRDANTLKCYTMRVTLLCGYAKVVQLLQDLEDSNPYVCIVGLQISSRTEQDAEEHNVTMDVQWPIWGDPSVPETIDKELRNNENIRI